MSAHGRRERIKRLLLLDDIPCTYGDNLLFNRGLIFYSPKLLLVNVLFPLHILSILHEALLLVLYIIYFAIWFPIRRAVI